MNARKGHTKEPVGVLQLPPHSAYLAVKVKPSGFSTAVHSVGIFVSFLFHDAREGDK